MTVKHIRSRDAAFQKFTVLLNNRVKRGKYGEFIAEGVRNINEAVKNGWRVVSFIYPNKKKLSGWAASLLDGIETEINYRLADELMAALSGKTDSSELMAVIKMKKETAFDFAGLAQDIPNPVFVLFDRPSNKGNLGTTLRSCDAFGASLLVTTGHSVDIYDPDVIAASAGSFFKQPFIKLNDNAEIDSFVESLKREYPALKIIGTTARGEKNIGEINLLPPVLLLIGNETDGLSRKYIEMSDVLAKIPMSAGTSASSLNVSCAAAVLFYETARQRAKTPSS